MNKLKQNPQLERLFLLENDYEGRDSFIFYKSETVQPGATSELLEFKTDARYGAITSFTIGFLGTLPAPALINTDYNLTWNDVPQPYTGAGDKLELFNLINQPINYFIPFNGAGNEVLRFSYSNSDFVQVYSLYFRVNGFYIKDKLPRE